MVSCNACAITDEAHFYHSISPLPLGKAIVRIDMNWHAGAH
jgi:hypothetical protein